MNNIDKSSYPKHIAIIMDGNGRWATAKNQPRTKGHLEGVNSLKDVIKQALELGIEYLTVFAFSTENWLRPEAEVNFIFELMKSTLTKNVNQLSEEGIKLNFIGEFSSLPKYLQEVIADSMNATKSCGKLVLNIALNYGGRWDIVNACKKIASDVSCGNLDVNDINENIFSKNMSLNDAPALDLFIRTSSEQRVSNFLLWELQYSEIYFSNKLWPDFKGKDLGAAIDWFVERERRFGGTN
ncbi:MAG: di-trans,poly-cis-decaprenylcistransferase [Francisellaceae bacterium]|jgi:undecaprenyl diphosphate synthase|nr:di-trans,poly-cis-decaprenylcistransferase [Francisellaceae bacterium]MBT6206622.1 di-trans,poly-cis-decaprenylcistransferase [Francisellaceae bacterium]MBT6539528.1 di-trans,poly-cis-decaprenylcistransferase [Francisellaceae bacterium]